MKILIACEPDLAKTDEMNLIKEWQENRNFERWPCLDLHGGKVELITGIDSEENVNMPYAILTTILNLMI